MSGQQASTPCVTGLSHERILNLLAEGEIDVEGLIPWSSNATLLATVRDAEFSTLAVYKPQRGERPLWDFPTGSLGKREVAAYLLCEALGWGFVPPTVLRKGPYGLGSVQFFIHAQEEAHFFTIQHDAAFRDVLMLLAAFDAIANNADRKSGHCLVDDEGRLWAIDNALTFHAEPKLHRLAETLGKRSPLTQALAHLLSTAELDALRRRLSSLIQAGHYPEPGPGRVVPWPLV
jgi:hypothetical protein